MTYCKANETDKALGLWTILQEEGEIPSELFLTYLGKHLQSKNREVPFIVPENQSKTKKQPKPTESKKQTPKDGPTKQSVSDQVEELVKMGKPEQAMDFALKSIQDGKVPKANVLKFLLKNLATIGSVDKIEALGSYLNDNMRRNVTYDDKLTLAVFVRGSGADHVDKLYEAVNTASNDQDLDVALRRFPRSNALASVMDDDELVKKCECWFLLSSSLQ